MPTDLSIYNNSWYNPGSAMKRFCWYLINIIFFKRNIFPLYGLKRSLLRLFGAKIGKGVIIKPFVNIKYPWFLEMGDHNWIGENVWIDNLGMITMGSNVCLSQGALLLSGNHDYTKKTFDLMVKPIILEEGVWIGAKAVVCPGVICRSHSILTVGSIATSNLEAFGIYSGNPAVKIKERVFES